MVAKWASRSVRITNGFRYVGIIYFTTLYKKIGFGYIYYFSRIITVVAIIGRYIYFTTKSENTAKIIALFGSFAVLAVSLSTLVFTTSSYYFVNYIWLSNLGTSFYLSLDGSGKILTLLTAVSFPIIF